MATRKFRVEFLKEFFDDDGYVAMIYNEYDHGGAKEDGDVVFRSKDDGKHYSFDYYFTKDVGIDSFDGVSNDKLIVCHEVEKREVTTVTWKKVDD